MQKRKNITPTSLQMHLLGSKIVQNKSCEIESLLNENWKAINVHVPYPAFSTGFG